MLKDRCFPALLVVAYLSGSNTIAQLNGTYSIDSASPTGGTNFTSFADAAAALISLGVNGTVAFLVAPSATPYQGFSITGAITGASPVNSITFLGGPGVIVSGVAPGFTQVIHLGNNSTATGTAPGPSDITLDGLEVSGAPSGAGIMISGCTNTWIRRCRVLDCGSGICSIQSTGTIIEDNEIFNVGQIPGTPGSQAYTGAITSYFNNNACVIQRNNVHDCTRVGIFVGTSDTTTMPLNNVVINNFVRDCAGTGTYSGGIAIRRSPGTIVANNTIKMPAGSPIAGIHQMVAGTGVSPQVIANNIVRHEGLGSCFRFESVGVVPATTFDFNLYDPAATAFVGGVGTATYASLPAWQALTAPNLATSEANSLNGPSGFVSSTDLHIIPGSLGYENGTPLPSVTLDIDLQPRPIGSAPERGADESPGSGLFASFTATPIQGPAPLLVTFADSSFTTTPQGITSWAWDFENDGTVDSTSASPAFTYMCPGTYSVSLTVTDSINPPSTLVRQAFITVSQFVFSMSSSGNGVGDLSVTPVPTLCFFGAAEGYTLVSLSGGMNPVGSGPFFGIFPDFLTIDGILSPAQVNNPLHFIPLPGSYPNVGSFSLPPGSVSGLSGVNLDAVQVVLSSSFAVLSVSNVARATL